MVRCIKPECDTDLPNEAKFCLQCGTPQPEQKKSVSCPKRKADGKACGSILQRGSKFCCECGWEINNVIFQHGSRPCSGRKENGTFCDGIIDIHDGKCSLCDTETGKMEDESNISMDTTCKDQKHVADEAEYLPSKPNVYVENSNTQSQKSNAAKCTVAETVTKPLSQTQNSSVEQKSDPNSLERSQYGMSLKTHEMQHTPHGFEQDREQIFMPSEDQIEHNLADQQPFASEVVRNYKENESVANLQQSEKYLAKNKVNYEEEEHSNQTLLPQEIAQESQKAQVEPCNEMDSLCNNKEITKAATNDNKRNMPNSDSLKIVANKRHSPPPATIQKQDDNAISVYKNETCMHAPEKQTFQETHIKNSENNSGNQGHLGIQKTYKSTPASNTPEDDGNDEFLDASDVPVSQREDKKEITRNEDTFRTTCDKNKSVEPSSSTQRSSKTSFWNIWPWNTDKKKGTETSYRIPSTGKQNTVLVKDSEVEITFHGILSPNMLPNPNESVYMVISMASGRWGYPSEHIRTYSGNYAEYKTTMRLIKRDLPEVLTYNYLVASQKTTRVEHVYDEDDNMHHLQKDVVIAEKGTFHQYDCIVDITRERSYFMISGRKNKLLKNAEKAFEVYLESLSHLYRDEELTAEDFVNVISKIIDGIRQVYFYRNALWNTDGEFMNFVKMVLSRFLVNKLQDMDLTQSMALGIVTLLDKYKLFWKDVSIVKLCKALAMKGRNKTDVTQELENVKKEFPNTINVVREKLHNFVTKTAKDSGNAYWLLCVPLLHFLWAKCKPYDPPSDDIDHTAKIPKWWGIENFEDAHEYFKGKSTWNMNIEEILRHLVPMFEMDYFLPRTLMTIMKFERLLKVLKSNCFTADICLATLHYHIKTRTLTAPDTITISTCLMHISEQLVCAESSVDGYRRDKFYFYRISMIGYRFWLEATKAIQETNMSIGIAAYIVIQAKAIFVKTKGQMEGEKKKDIFKNIEEECCQSLMKWLKRSTDFSTQSKCKSALKTWDFFLNKDLPDGKMCSAFKQEMKNSLESTITANIRGSDLIDLYCTHGGQYGFIVQDLLSKVSMKTVMEDVSQQRRKFQSSSKVRYEQLLIAVFKNYLAASGSSELYKEALAWPMFQHLLQTFYKMNACHVDEECNSKLNALASTLKDKMEILETGEISIKDIKIISDKASVFEQLLSVIWERDETKDFSNSKIQNLLKIRNDEIEAFSEYYRIVSSFLMMCERIGVEATEMQQTISDLSNVEDVSIKTLCHSEKSSELQGSGTYKHTVIAFNIDEDTIELILKVLSFKKSTVFIRVWEEVGRCVAEAKEEILSFKDTITDVINPVLDLWETLCDQMKNGNLVFKGFQKICEGIEGEQLLEEFKMMSIGGSEEWIVDRLTQVQQYRELQGCVEGAKAILGVVECYDLKGNFLPIKLITDVLKYSNMEMKTIDKSMLKTCADLRDISSKHSECLIAFKKSKPLVDWLKESMPSGLKELKVFVDLASISAGEGDMEIGRVQCFHAATKAYAPLIFNLNNDIDYQDFLDKCKIVWKELEADPDLPKKLCDTNRYLEWLKTVQKTHGSIAVNSLKQAETINSVGIYQIGKLKNSKGNKSDLEDVVSLHVPDGDKSKMYVYGQLHDLQSRLMLIAGKAEKGKDEVERFTLILDSVVRLGNVYTRLLSAGCVLFSEWKAKLLCDPKRMTCCFIEFGEGEDRVTLKGQKKNQKDEVSSIVPGIAKFMETCLEEWMAYVTQKRDKYYQLNFVTIDQMVILQKELAKIGSSEIVSSLVFPILSAIKINCSLKDIIEAMKEAKEELEREKAEIDNPIPEESEDVKEMKRKEKDFIDTLVGSGFSESLSRKALNEFGVDNTDDALVWCMEHNGNEDDDSDHIQMGIQTGHFEGWAQNQKSLLSVTADILEPYAVGDDESMDPLAQGMEVLWKKYLSSVSSSVSDYLSVEHLGLILRKLAAKETFLVKRHFSSSFKIGTPNLITCPQADILNTVLTIYMHDDTQPLPQPDEVLICSKNTTFDQLDIFWRRAVSENSERIHCLVNGDLLNYDVSDKAEQNLEDYLRIAKEKGIDYRLVVVCSSENEYKSRIVASLDRFRQPRLPVANLKSIQQYLQRQLQINCTEELIENNSVAAIVDFDRSTVRVVKSWKAGVGKTLYKQRMENKLRQQFPNESRKTEISMTIPLHEREIDVDTIMFELLKCTLMPGICEPRIFHIDISHEVRLGVDGFLFHLLILGSLTNSEGYVWRKSSYDHYLIETMPQFLNTGLEKESGEFRCEHHCLDILPDVICRSPQESKNILSKLKSPSEYNGNDRLFDYEEFTSQVFQRPYQYLARLDKKENFLNVNAENTYGDELDCLQTLLRHCGLKDPSWAELKHFVWFLNTQLKDFEVSAFCGMAAVDILPGFANFVLHFLIQMSRDFSTRSLKMSEESPEESVQVLHCPEDDEEYNEIQQFQMRRTWESSPHPYIFFNPDHNSMTFLGFNINRTTGDLIDHQTGRVLERAIMPSHLYDSLLLNKVDIDKKFDSLSREDKIQKICSVMGVDKPYDPDETYELTTDNVKKILAIYMRFRCDIPVIIMGETGCGKTRLVKYLCSLQCPKDIEMQNMILMKVHGGTTSTDIIRKVTEAEEIAKQNQNKFDENGKGGSLYTVLFFDETNTTEAIGLIKEIMCDKTLGGKPLQLYNNLKIIAACNPYRRHSDEMVNRLEQAGLGYHVDAENTTDKLGQIPMRRLVYRVQPLPQSLLPLVWDFGQLDTEVEILYIRQMVLRYISRGKLPREDNLENVLSAILTASQDFMRKQKDECSFVSLRDVERVLEVTSWFYGQGQSKLFAIMDNKNEEEAMSEEESSSDEEEEDQFVYDEKLSAVTRSFILALGVCYHACLKKRKQYRDVVASHFTHPCLLPGGSVRILREIEKCQNVFLRNVQLGQNIAQNQALKENVFMMVTCIELKIPLFLVGKPGSSKSLAKTIVADAMQGHSSHKQFYKTFKAAQMVSFQCSPLSVPEGIVGTFRQCANFQKNSDLETFVSVVVLDEVGLAEDSPRMPLKTLHPLLEDGCEGDEEPEPYKKVAFVGISNWALDPAKMNRGILVQRTIPELDELTESARGICSSKQRIFEHIRPYIKGMSEAYLDLFQVASEKRREFFGLRDFYSLLKMVYAFADRHDKRPTWKQLQHAILRNFGGLEDVNPVQVFASHLGTQVNLKGRPYKDDPDCTPKGLIEAALQIVRKKSESENRYLLLLTESLGGLYILQQKVLKVHDAITIFGSSFPSDQEYTQVCRNINRIKVCMETGNTVILLNLENLYESLYDALNQYYVEFGGERYVDLGLGTHRVKCRVHKQFRLIVVAEKKVVYEKFPIPLINRLEKHFLNISTMLTEKQLQVVKEFKEWIEKFTRTQPSIRTERKRTQFHLNVSDVFIGYHSDTSAAAIFHVTQERFEATKKEQILLSAKKLLLWCSTPDSVMRLSSTPLKEEAELLTNEYFLKQQHECLSQYLAYRLSNPDVERICAQITTHSKLLTSVDLVAIRKLFEISKQNTAILNLQSFDTEQQFCRHIRECIDKNLMDQKTLLVVQSDCSDQNSNLLASARYCIQDELHQHKNKNLIVLFIIQIPRTAGSSFRGFQCGYWHSLHIDDLRPADKSMPTIPDMRGKSIGVLIHDAVSKMECKYDLESSTNKIQTADEYLEEMPHEVIYDRKRMTKQQDQIDKSDVDNVQTQNLLPVHRLIYSCIQSALAMVKDTKHNTSRGTKRVDILLQLLHLTDNNALIVGLSKNLDVLMQERERRSPDSSKWLTTEAASAENINTAGTFRRAWMLCIETKVIPLLAIIIAFLDTNCNLDCLASSKQGSWKQQLWMTIINCPVATDLHFEHLTMLSKGNRNFTQVDVKCTGYEGRTFTSEMPFSWLIFRLIEEVIDTTQNHLKTDNVVDVIMETNRLILNKLLGKFIHPLLENSRQDIIESYLSDFIYMMYPVVSAEEHKLVHGFICKETAALLKYQFNVGIAAMIGFHVSFQHNISLLNNFSSIHRVWPECSKHMLEENKQSESYQTGSLDVHGVELLLSKLEPAKDMLNQAEGRNEWLRCVHRYRPVIERILSNRQQNVQQRSNDVNDIGLKWTRVLIVKLFLEHLCSVNADEENSLSVKNVMPLWSMMKGGADFKKLEYLKKLELFLKACNRSTVIQVFSISKNTSHCKHCTVQFSFPPVSLPCEDVICIKCYNDIRTLESNECPVCKKPVPDEFDPEKNWIDDKLFAKYQDYKTRCNRFFVEVVSQLCFAGRSVPEDDVIEKLLKYITMETKDKKTVTKEFSVFEDEIDQTPVLRTSLLQIILRSSEEKAYRYLDGYLKQANLLVKEMNEGDSALGELCLLVMQCIEDSYHHSVLVSENPEKMEMTMAKSMLKDVANVIGKSNEKDIDNLTVLARTRFGLIVTAKYMQMMLIEEKGEKRRPTKRARGLFNTAIDLCRKCQNLCSGPCMYLVKQLCRGYGLESYDIVNTSKDPSLQMFAEIANIHRTTLECTDNFVVCGQDYLAVREVVAKCLLGENVKYLEEQINKTEGNDWKIRTMLLLALYRESTMTIVYPKDQRKVKNAQPIVELLKSKLFQNHKSILQDLVANSIWQYKDLNVREGLTLQDQSLLCLLLHAFVIFQQIPGERHILQPLLSLARQPQNMTHAFLPTMPQDETEDIRITIRAALKNEGNATFYACPNGHTYAIFDCGRPVYKYLCHECGAPIGGSAYNVLQPGNVKEELGQPKTGHILGNSEQSTDIPERKMTPVECSILRLLTHIAMTIGANKDEQAIRSMIKRGIGIGSVFDFLLSHIKLGIKHLQTATGYNIDDVLIVLHDLLRMMFSSHGEESILDPEMCGLTSKDSRNQWEEKFKERYLAPFLQTMDKNLKANNLSATEDKRLGSDPLLCLLYETDTNDTTGVLHDSPAVWMYRKRVSMDHLRTEFHTKIKNENKALNLFIQEEKQLRALRLIPSIVRLQKVLIRRYEWKLDRIEADNMTIREVLEEFERDISEKDMSDLIHDFIEAWEYVRRSLSNYNIKPYQTAWLSVRVCSIGNAHLRVPGKFCDKSITKENSLSILLPSRRGNGICSYVLLYYLLEKQNSFLDKLSAVTKQRFDDMPKVKAAEVTQAHLISYYPDRDVLSIVQASCNYSFEVGRGTTIEYDFHNIEKQIMDRILFAKSYFDLNEIETMTYKLDNTDANILQLLRDKVPQEPLDAVVKHQIGEEFKSSLPEICDCLDKVDATISFLKSIGETPDCLLITYMTKTLKMENPLFSQKAKQACHCKHIQSLWIVLSLEKTKCLADFNSDIFDNIGQDFHNDLRQEQEKILQGFCDGLRTDKLYMIIEYLFEYIVLKMSLYQNPDDEEFFDVKESSLRDYLIAYVDDVSGPELLTHTLMKLPGDEEDPNSIQVCQAIGSWLCLYNVYKERDNARQRN